MRFGERVYELLSDDAAVTALIGTRIYPLVIPQSSPMPAVAYTVISDTPENSLQGYTSNLRRARMQIDCYARSYSGSQALADAVAGVLGSYITVGFKASQVVRRDLYEAEMKLNRVSMDFQLWSAES